MIFKLNAFDTTGPRHTNDEYELSLTSMLLSVAMPQANIILTRHVSDLKM